ncbi:hypothetical protein CCUS01_14844 [Colletotrichum cuscutae]|uniref:Uncharacterized protein n=1 Tax=Colletotrichum cuscutae TaxID=1209917 RepID=A0AAI9Y6D9_9PEZI|nr:hypothetical protein CCUS01_14844 [Colletotrichum cuscutae]
MSIGKTVTREPQPQKQCGLGKPPKRGWITESRMQVTDPIPSAAASGHTPALGNARREKGERSRSARRIRSECRQPPGSGRREGMARLTKLRRVLRRRHYPRSRRVLRDRDGPFGQLLAYVGALASHAAVLAAVA